MRGVEQIIPKAESLQSYTKNSDYMICMGSNMFSAKVDLGIINHRVQVSRNESLSDY